MKIVGIGGGEIKDRETLKIDRFIVNLAGKATPKALFIPTASGDAEGYCDTFDRIYGKLLGCKTDHLLLLRNQPSYKTIEKKILSADIIYVGGGNSLRMMKCWRQLGVDKLLKAAGARGTILSGLSAGAICWHEWGHSDSLSFSGRSDWPYIKVRGLGFAIPLRSIASASRGLTSCVPGIFCPHLDVEKRRKPFAAMVAEHNWVGIACDNRATVFYDGASATCITSRKTAKTYIYQPDGSVSPFSNGERLPAAE